MELINILNICMLIFKIDFGRTILLDIQGIRFFSIFSCIKTTVKYRQ